MEFDAGNLKVSKEEIIDLFKKVITKLYKCDYELFKNNVQERSLVARLSMYLRDSLICLETNQIYVDVEYNRDGDSLKRSYPEKVRKWFAPDILVHERGSKKNNYRNDIVFCEVKKDSESGHEDASRITTQMKVRKYAYGIDLYKLSPDECCFDLYYFSNEDNKIQKESYKFNNSTKTWQVN